MILCYIRCYSPHGHSTDFETEERKHCTTAEPNARFERMTNPTCCITLKTIWSYVRLKPKWLRTFTLMATFVIILMPAFVVSLMPTFIIMFEFILRLHRPYSQSCRSGEWPGHPVRILRFQDGPSWVQEGPSGVKFGPSWDQVGPN